MLSFDRMIELGRTIAAEPERHPECVLPVRFEDELARMLRDELAHKAVFERIADHLGDDDGLRDGVASDDVHDAIASVRGWFEAAVPSRSDEGRGAVPSAESSAVCRGGLKHVT